MAEYQPHRPHQPHHFLAFLIFWAAVETLHSLSDGVIRELILTARSAHAYGEYHLGVPVSESQIGAVRTASYYSDEAIDWWLSKFRPFAYYTSVTPNHSRLARSYPYGRYWCTLCHELRPFDKRDSWRKHEKEHEEHFRCQLLGPEQANMSLPLGCVRTFFRRQDMCNHLLEVHGFQDKTTAEERANAYRILSGKRYWSCGFCVALFDSFSKRLDHLRNEHFAEDAPPRDQSNLSIKILGLIIQPLMATAWDTLLAARCGWPRPEIFWQDSAPIDHLLYMLQVGVDDMQSADILAQALLALSNLGQDLPNLDSTFENHNGRITPASLPPESLALADSANILTGDQAQDGFSVEDGDYSNMDRDPLLYSGAIGDIQDL